MCSELIVDTDFEIYCSSIWGMQLAMSEFGGVNRSGADAPTGNPIPAPMHPHRTHDRSMARDSIGSQAKTVYSWPRGRRVVSLADVAVGFFDTSNEILIFSQKM